MSDFGHLHLPTTPAEAPAEPLWSQITLNQVLIVVAVLLSIVAILDLIRILPTLKSCMIRSRGNVSMEHSMSQARMRNRCGAIMLLSFCLIADRHNFAGADFAAWVPSSLHCLSIIALMVAYLLVRKIIFSLVISAWPLTHSDSETSAALHTSLYNYFIVGMLILLPVVAILDALKLQNTVIQQVALGILGFFFLLTIIRLGQILRTNCSGLGMFLYLCALEILPLGALILAALFL